MIDSDEKPITRKKSNRVGRTATRPASSFLPRVFDAVHRSAPYDSGPIKTAFRKIDLADYGEGRSSYPEYRLCHRFGLERKDIHLNRVPAQTKPIIGYIQKQPPFVDNELLVPMTQCASSRRSNPS